MPLRKDTDIFMRIASKRGYCVKISFAYCCVAGLSAIPSYRCPVEMAYASTTTATKTQKVCILISIHMHVNCIYCTDRNEV